MGPGSYLITTSTQEASLDQEGGYLYLRVQGGDLPKTIRFIKDKWAQHDTTHPFEYSFLDQRFNEQYKADEVQYKLLSGLSYICIFISLLGLLGLSAFSATQRTKEIGVRKAIGARRADIRLQFLLEAVVLTLVGGTIGILIGSGISTLVRALAPSIPATLPYLWVSIGFGISVGVGLFFGYYPANVAANLDPIDCLRYE